MDRLFSVADREAVRQSLVDRARADPEVIAAAVLGSGAIGQEDRWSDIDLALRLQPGVDLDQVAARWSAAVHDEHGAVHTLDVHAAGALYRVFLLASSLQVDLSFWSADEFRAHGPRFALMFGEANPAAESPDPDPERMIGTAWLYALHVRSALARGRSWQAVQMLDWLRDQVVELACLRHGLERHHGRGVDRLPAPVLATLAAARARTVDAEELRRSAIALLRCLSVEIDHVDGALAARLDPVLTLLAPKSEGR